MVQDQALQYFFAFKTKMSSFAKILGNVEENYLQKQSLVHLMNDTEIETSKVTYDLEPLATNQYLLRIFNLADRFDDRRELGFDNEHF